MRTECDEVADNIPLPSKRLTFDEALAIVREAMPDETVTVIDNVALLADAALEGLLQVAATPSQQQLRGRVAPGACRSRRKLMHALLGLAVLSLLIRGVNSIVLKLLSEIKSGLKYWRRTARR